MSDLRHLYQEMIIDHGRHPRHFGPMDDANRHQEGFNPLCGDKIILHLKESQGVIRQLQFEGCGCAISMASASLMSEYMQGKTKAQFEALFQVFHTLVTIGTFSEEGNVLLGKLTVLGGVSEFPARVKCATLAWHTLNAALNHSDSLVSTE